MAPRTCSRSAPSRRRLRALARDEGATPYMVLLAAYQILFHRYTNQDDVLVDTTMIGRSDERFHAVIGNFFAPVIMRGRLGGNPTFRAYLAQVRQTAVGALTHQDYPFPLLVEKLRPARDPARPPLAQVSFGLHKPLHRPEQWLLQSFVPDGAPTVQWGEWQVTPLNVGLLEGMYELDLELYDLDDRMSGFLIYNTNLFSPATAARMAANFVTLLDAIVQHPDMPIRALPLLSDGEREQLLAGGNSPVDPVASHPPVHELFEEQARRTPDADAIIYQPDGQSPVHLTYAQLNAQANRLAHHLRALGIVPGKLAGICVAPSVDMVVGLLAILKAGGAYVPMDPAYPAPRIGQMVEEAGISVLLTQTHLRDRLPAGDAPLVTLDAQPAPWADLPDENLNAGATGDDLIYAIFTSGSTGKPKGAGVYHRGFTNLVANWYVDALAMTPRDRVLLMTSFSFDLTQKNLYAPLVAGGTLVIADLPYFDPAEFCRVIQAQQISWINCTPSMFNHLLDAAAESDAARLHSLRTVVLGGEPIAVERLHAWAASRPEPPRIINSYGPTECTDVCAAHVLNLAGNDYAGGVPIGRPIANVRLYILDDDLQLAPMGAVGELCIGGVGVGAGYLNDAALTAAKFVEDHHVPAAGRLYRTGDSAKFLPDGEILFLGRLDNQVKLRGMRIELGDVESTLAAHPAVREAVVVLQPRTDDARLVAYVVAARGAGSQGDRAAATHELRAYLESRLPAYMVPAAYVYLDQLPLTPSGKVDRQALTKPDARAETVSEPSPISPRSALEAELAALWSRELGVTQIDVNESFFALGGDSFSAIRIVTALKAKGYVVPLRRVFEQPTVAGLAGVLAEQQPNAAASNGRSLFVDDGETSSQAPPVQQTEPAATRVKPPLVAIRPGGSKPPLFCVHPVMGVTYPYYALAHHLDPDQPVFALQSIGLEPDMAPDETIEAMAARYVAALRAHRPHGPYHLCGWSFGGWVAYEMAVQLQAAGEPVALLAIIDATALTKPASRWARRKSNLTLTGVIARNVGPFILPYMRELRAVTDAEPWGRHDRKPFFALAGAHIAARLRRQQPGDVRVPAGAAGYAGPLTLLRTAYQAGETTPDLGWGALCRQEAEVILIPGNHMTALREPHVADLGKRLQALWMLRRPRRRLRRVAKLNRPPHASPRRRR
ncbi:MAG: amino acid adenylation domain-containing protein [Caldilineaceae bacterium]